MVVDKLYDDLEAEFANEEVIGGTGNEIAMEQFQPGFMYQGPAGGEAAARAQYETPVGPPDYRGNAYAHQFALDFDRRKAQADAEREIEYAYKEANTAQQRKAIESAVNYQKQQEMNRLVAGGMGYAQAALQTGMWNTPGQLSKLMPEQAAMPKSYEVEGGVVERGPNGEWREVYRAQKPPRQEPVTMVTEKIPAVAGSPAVPADSGQRSFLGMDWMRKDVPPTAAIPEVLAQPERTIRRPMNAQPPTGNIEEAPNEPSKRVKDKIYNTPKGALRWTGTGWTNQ